MGLKAYLLGLKGEDKAEIFLKKQGFVIIERNFHSKFGEIDIIAQKDNVVHFIEVKSTDGDYEASYRLDGKKYEKILKTLNFYLLKKGLNKDFQVDLLCMYKNKTDFRENIVSFILGFGKDCKVIGPDWLKEEIKAVSYTHLTLPTNREV